MNENDIKQMVTQTGKKSICTNKLVKIKLGRLIYMAETDQVWIQALERSYNLNWWFNRKNNKTGFLKKPSLRSS